MKHIILILLISSLTVFAQGITIGSGTTFIGGSASIYIPGNWNNSGTFNAGSSTVILNGSGSDQTITNDGGETFYNLTVNKSGNDVVLVDNITINKSLCINNGDLNLNGQTCYMGSSAELTETNGNTVKGISGTITATRALNAPNLVNVAGLGAVITSSADMGTTVVTRGHTAQSGEGNSGILRYYDISPANNNGLNATLAIYYDDSELNGIDEGTLCMFSSGDAGSSWTTMGGNCTTSDNIIEYSGIDGFSRWTAAGTGAPLPVELMSFEASITEDGILLNWQTATEVNNYGFEVEMSLASSVDSTGTNWETLGFVPGNGNSNSPKEYKFIDTVGYNPGQDTVLNLQYRLKQIDTDGSFKYFTQTADASVSFIFTSIIGEDAIELPIKEEEAVELPTEFGLYQNYPNPFNPTTTIKYSVPALTSFLSPDERVSGGQVRVILKVYDMLGRDVAILVNEVQPAGSYSIKFNASTLAGGVYIYSLKAGEYISTKKLTLMK